MNFKFKCQDQPGVGHINNFRSAEMLLIEAEANTSEQHIGSSAKPGSPYTNFRRDPNYICTKTGAALLEEIKTYRGIELWEKALTGLTRRDGAIPWLRETGKRRYVPQRPHRRNHTGRQEQVDLGCTAPGI